ncbi:MAG: biopolymer transporter ExbD [Bacteroidia bacterium]|nr:biopolymer transporter ExbD [Bacteroidia bacterium]
MSNFKKKKEGGGPQINTASLPDIIFMLLIFFMVTTTIRKASLLVEIRPPAATEIQKLKKKSLVAYIYIGQPKTKAAKAKYGTEPRIQLDDAYADVKEIAEFVERERDKRDEKLRNKIFFSLRVDKESKMGIVTDVKQELRKAQAYKINYSTTVRNEFRRK